MALNREFSYGPKELHLSEFTLEARAGTSESGGTVIKTDDHSRCNIRGGW
ncbi:Uu.00g099550.m01.CDS01 [Anthostomella pinea]|uniref:Uu.00g099550.m01.CDS01 n=1 Tax=Anthostomella pinea TaxID=933095 RepID=A0AAI8YF52_9PEZI|nr:Uu.00g099550.m01.CDS01 [Anthostomella pinea]